MADVIQQLQDSIDKMFDQDFFPEHLRGRKISDLNEDELLHAKMIINNHTQRLIRQAEEPARIARHEKMKAEGSFAHSWMLLINTKMHELIGSEAKRRGIKRDGWLINEILEEYFGLPKGSSVPKGYEKK